MESEKQNKENIGLDKQSKKVRGTVALTIMFIFIFMLIIILYIAITEKEARINGNANAVSHEKIRPIKLTCPTTNKYISQYKDLRGFGRVS